MNRTLLKNLLVLTGLICHTVLFAQKDFERHEFSFHAGYGNMLNGTPTLTQSTHHYQRTLAQGVSWDGQYHFRPLKRFIFGAVYSGFSSTGNHPEGSDHLWIHFIGTQIGVCNAHTKHWQARMGAGAGGVFLRNQSEVFGKPRKVKGWNIGLLLNSNLTYKLTPHLGIGIGVQYLVGGLVRMKTYYHGETITVRLDADQESDLSRLNIHTGISCYF